MNTYLRIVYRGLTLEKIACCGCVYAIRSNASHQNQGTVVESSELKSKRGSKMASLNYNTTDNYAFKLYPSATRVTGYNNK